MNFVPIFVPLFLEEDHEPVDWKCVTCGHSWKKHMKNDNPTTQCQGKILGVCGCHGFVLDVEQVTKIRKKLKEIEDTLFKNLKKAENKQK